MTEPLARLSAALEDRYRVERKLGEGGMATVYLAEEAKGLLDYDVSKDGKRVLALLSNRDDFQLVVAPNWITEFRRRMAASRPK